MEVAAVGLSPWEHQVLGRIAEELTGSDPKLASLAAGFNRLAASEEMPPRPHLRRVRRSRRGARNRPATRHSARASWFFATAWFLAAAGMIALALVLNLLVPGTDGNRGCAQSRAVSCAGDRLGALPVLSPGPSS
jgi:hypothetical protein